MLDSFIIEELRRREQRERESQRPVLELPVGDPVTDDEAEEADEDAPERGVIVIDL